MEDKCEGCKCLTCANWCQGCSSCNVSEPQPGDINLYLSECDSYDA